MKNGKKETETEETIGFFVTFLSLVKFQLRTGRTPCPPPLGHAYAPSEENKKGARKFSAKFLAFSNKISTVQKTVLSSSRGQGNFRGLEALRPRTWPSRPRPRTSKCVLEAKDVLKDSTSGKCCFFLFLLIIFYHLWLSHVLSFHHSKAIEFYVLLN